MTYELYEVQRSCIGIVIKMMNWKNRKRIKCRQIQWKKIGEKIRLKLIGTRANNIDKMSAIELIWNDLTTTFDRNFLELNWVSLYNSHLFDHDHWSASLESNDPAHITSYTPRWSREEKNNKRPKTSKNLEWGNCEGGKVNHIFPKLRDPSMRFIRLIGRFQLPQR